MKKFPYRDFIHKYFSKVLLSLPTQADVVGFFGKTLIGGFSCVNTCLAFDSETLLRKGADGKPK